MRKFFGFLFLLLAMATTVQAQVSAITITGIPTPPCGSFNQSMAVTFTVTDAGDYGVVNYDILFSSAVTASNTAYSSFLGGTMICSRVDSGYHFQDQGQASNTIVQMVPVPAVGAGNLIILAQENVSALTCSNPQTYVAFTIPCNTPTNTATNTTTNTATSTFTPTATFTFTPTGSYTPTTTNTFTQTFTKTFTNTFTNTFTQTVTKTATNTSTSTNTNTTTNTFTNASTWTPTITPTQGVPLANPNTGGFDQWQDTCPSLTCTPGTGRVDDPRLNSSIGKWALARQTTTAPPPDVNVVNQNPTPPGGYASQAYQVSIAGGSRMKKPNNIGKRRWLSVAATDT